MAPASMTQAARPILPSSSLPSFPTRGVQFTSQNPNVDSTPRHQPQQQSQQQHQPQQRYQLRHLPLQEVRQNSHRRSHPIPEPRSRQEPSVVSPDPPSGPPPGSKGR